MLESALVYEREGQVWTDSKILADTFRKRHDHVLKKIEKQLTEYSTGFVSTNFLGDTQQVQIGEYGQTRESKIYRLTRDGFMAVGMTMTGKKAARFREKILEAFNALETALGAKYKPAELQALLQTTAAELERERRLRLVAEEEADYIWARLDGSKIGPKELHILDCNIRSAAEVALEKLEWGDNRTRRKKEWQLVSVIKRLVKARYTWKHNDATYKEIAVQDFEDCLNYLRSIPVWHLELAVRSSNIRTLAHELEYTPRRRKQKR